MPYNYQRDFYGSDDYYGSMREDARNRLLDVITRSGRNLGGIYDAQLEGNRLDQIQQARTGAPNAMLGGAALGANFGKPGLIIGAGIGAASGLKGSYDANRQLGKGRWQSALGAVGDVLSPGNMLKSPMVMPAVMGMRGLSKQNALGSYLGGYEQVGNEMKPYRSRFDQFGNEIADFDFEDDEDEDED